MNRWRTLLAFLIAPVMTPLVFGVREVSSGTTIMRELPYFVILLPYSYSAEILFGIPAFIVFRRWRIRSYLAYGLTGALIGEVVYVLSLINGVEAYRLLTPFSRDWWLSGGWNCVVAASS